MDYLPDWISCLSSRTINWGGAGHWTKVLFPIFACLGSQAVKSLSL